MYDYQTEHWKKCTSDGEWHQTAAELSAMQKWLDAAVYFILTECNGEEQTLRSLFDICARDPTLLGYLYGRDEDERLQRPEVLTKERLEAAVSDMPALRGLLGGTRAENEM